MRTLLVSLIATSFIFFTGCDDDFVGTGPLPGEGQIMLIIPSHPPEVVSLQAILSRPGAETLRTTIPLAAPNQPVIGTIANVPAGTWHLGLNGIASGGAVPYTGGADLAVPADSVVTATVVFNPLTGTIELGSGGGPGACVSPQAGMVSWWTGEDSPYDAADGNDGAPGWPGASYAPGRVGRAFRFDGVSGQIRVPDNPNLRITGSLTIEGWILAEGYPEGRASGQILFRGDDRIGIDPYFLTMMPDGRLLFHVASLTAAANLQTPEALGLGTWHHVAAVLDDATGAMTIYLDGAAAVATTTSVRPFRDLDPTARPGLGIGNTQSENLYHDQPFHGIIDELTIYAAALSDVQVRGIYTADRDGKCGPNPPPPPDSLTVTVLAAGFERPAGLVMSNSGRLLVADFWDPGFIYSVTAAGVVDTFAWGGGRAVAALARDASGYIYGTYQDGTVKRAAPGGGVLSTFIGGIGNPAGIAVHPNGNIYVVDAADRSVDVYSPAGSPVASISVSQTEPVGLAIHPNGTVYLADYSGNRVMKIDSAGGVSVFVGGIPRPHDMAFDAQGKLFVAGGDAPGGNNVYVVSPLGAVGQLPHHFIVPVGVTFDGAGNLYVSNFGSNFVSKVVFPR